MVDSLAFDTHSATDSDWAERLLGLLIAGPGRIAAIARQQFFELRE
jgi:hypothetical protein